MTTGTTFANINVGEHFIFVDEATEPKSPEGLDGNVWVKTSFHKIKKMGEAKTSAIIFKKGTTHVTMVAKNLDELIVNNPQPVSCNKR